MLGLNVMKKRRCIIEGLISRLIAVVVIALFVMFAFLWTPFSDLLFMDVSCNSGT
jgi:hypothetical protein